MQKQPAGASVSSRTGFLHSLGRRQVLSTKKRQLAMAERLAGCAIGACVIVTIACGVDGALAKFMMPIILFAIGTMFYLAVLIAGLTTELNRALGKWPSPTGEGPYSTTQELRKQLQWSPRSFKLGALAAIGGVVGTAGFFGAVSWSTGESMTSSNVIGASLYLCFILLIELPLIASAVRMPGAFKDNILLLGKSDAA
jgi:hypothetical protein